MDQSRTRFGDSLDPPLHVFHAEKPSVHFVQSIKCGDEMSQARPFGLDMRAILALLSDFLAQRQRVCSKGAKRTSA
jgi:hypothetical protein